LVCHAIAVAVDEVASFETSAFIAGGIIRQNVITIAANCLFGSVAFE